ncbi:MAG TPA: hypothetical protein VEA61_09195 [Allosphingosinicella sp.]|nr:hypothetical protein [Allosphingosinicella sp.]
MNPFRLLALLPALAAPAAAAEPADDSPPIVITGKPLKDTERALADCLARRCPPDRDIDATLAHAENLFVAGDYKAARRTTLASIGRNKGQARAYPMHVSELYRANGRIAAHLGEGRSYEFSTTAIKRALRAGLPDDDVRLLGAELEIAAMHASFGRLDQSRRAYQEVQRRARRLGREDIAAAARVRAAWLNHLAGHTELARRALREIAAERAPASRMPRLTALILLARLDRGQGDHASSDALIEQLRAVGTDRPVLLFSPQVELPRRRVEGESGSATRRMAMEPFEKQWVDVGFRVTPEGRVDDVEVLRSQGNTRWAEPVLRSIAGRLYSPVAAPGGTYRVERYSFTSMWDHDAPGTRLRRRSPDARIEMLDLTSEPEPSGR